MLIGVETGGTKIFCAERAPGGLPEVRAVERIPTTTPVESAERINAYLRLRRREEPITAIGLASFGPVHVEVGGERYGRLGGTPKPGWAGFDLVGALDVQAGVPIRFLGDVAAAALGEYRFGAAAGVENAAYATVGTGIGVGIVVRGELVHGDGWPELGHILVRRHPLDTYQGSCPYHGDCLEGLASGPAVIGRWGTSTAGLLDEQRAMAVEVLAFYVAQLVLATAIATGTRRMVLGGGVMKTPALLDAVRASLLTISGGPGAGNALPADVERFVVAPALGDLSGVLGALAAAEFPALLGAAGASQTAP